MMRTLILTLTLLFVSSASAHTIWRSPIPRNSNDNVKAGPCGPQGVTANIKPPLANASNVYLSGSTVNISWSETVNHTGYFWVDLARTDLDLLDYDPNDPDPANNNRATVWRLSPAPPANFPDNNTIRGFTFTEPVTLPAGVTCDNCTMRLVQYMENAGQPYYYSCADVRILNQADAITAALSSYATTVHPVLRQSCVACHDVGGPGFGAHAAADHVVSHKVLKDNNWVNFDNPETSQIVAFAENPAHAAGFTGPGTGGANLREQIVAWVNGPGRTIASIAADDIPADTNEANNVGNGGNPGALDQSSNAPVIPKATFGGCGSINGGGPGGPTGWGYVFVFLLPLAFIYAGKRSPITVRR